MILSMSVRGPFKRSENGNFYCDIGRKRICLWTKDLNKAKEDVRQLCGIDLENKRKDIPREKLDLKESIKKYLFLRSSRTRSTQKNDRLSLNHLLRFLGNVQVKSIKTENIEEFKTTLY